MASRSDFQLNSGLLLLLQEEASGFSRKFIGCVGEEIVGIEGGFGRAMGVGVGRVAGFGAGVEYDALRLVRSILVPLPSFASTSPDTYCSTAFPCAFMRSVAENRSPEEPL